MIHKQLFWLVWQKKLDTWLFKLMVSLEKPPLILLDTKKSITFRAHQSQIGSLELDHVGKKVTTASEKVYFKTEIDILINQLQGTVIRIFDTETGSLLTELRRGSEYAQIFSLAFDINSKWLACSSDTCTIHIFSLQGKS